ncbi:MAG: competence/damage-inducible protein A [Actinobacteria bacterium]|nr:competence/damage-inducible protein A [Actinomycetota bacterium]
MRAEIVGVGTELLLGQIANTNAQEISQMLATAGVDVHHHVAVGDNLDRAADAIATALGRADAVIVTGGLGPTPDDLTREAVAKVLGRPLVRDETLASVIRGIFDSLGRAMPEDNLKQADLPEGAEPIAPEGTAPGLIVRTEGKVLFCVPGVPWEMQAMMEKTVLPELRSMGGAAVLATREILVVGLGESHTHQAIADLVAAQSNPTIAYLASAGLVKVRLTAKATTEDDALSLIRPLETEIRARLGTNAIEGEGATVAQVLGWLLKGRGETVAVAESLTGGSLGAELTKAEGASEFFLGSIVAYTTEAKARVVGVDRSVLEDAGPVSEETAAQLAERAAERFGADLGLSTTGVAGPAPQDGQPVGTVYVAASYKGTTEVRKPKAYGGRDHIRAIAVTSAIDLGRRVLGG